MGSLSLPALDEAADNRRFSIAQPHSRLGFPRRNPGVSFFDESGDARNLREYGGGDPAVQVYSGGDVQSDPCVYVLNLLICGRTLTVRKHQDIPVAGGYARLFVL